MRNDIVNNEMDTKLKNHNAMCVAHASKVLGDKWSPLLINALASEPMRFCALQTKVGGINPRTLSARLDDLEAMGVISKQCFAEVPPRVEYSLTDKGRDLMPILQSMAAWGDKYPQ